MEQQVLENIELLKHARFEVSGENLLKLAKTIAANNKESEPEKPVDERIINQDDACEILNVSKVTLHDWHKKGILMKRHIGRRVYYYMSDIKDVLDNKQRRGIDE